MLHIPKLSHNIRCPALELLGNSLCGSQTKSLQTPALEPHLRYEASHMFDKIKQKVCANMPKGTLNNCVDKEQFKINWLQTVYNAKLTFTQKQIPRQNEEFNLY